MQLDLHNSEGKLVNAFKCLDTDKDISKRNKELIRQYIDMKHSGCHDKTRDIHTLRLLAKHLDMNFDQVNNGQMHKLFTKFETGEIKREDGQPYKSTGKFVKTARAFYVKLIKKPKAVEGLKASSKLKDLKQSDFWTREEILEMPNHATKLRDKCLVTMLSTGCNISEIGRLLVADIVVGKDYLTVGVRNSKNAHRTRTLYVFDNTVYILNWLDNHPLRDSKDWPNVPLFVSDYKDHKPLCYISFKTIIHDVAKKVNPNKPSNTHIFRNSIAFWKHKNRMPDLELCRSMGWSLDSGMKARYVRCSDERVLVEELALRGLQKEENKPKDKVVHCVKCQMRYTRPTQPRCARCGTLLDAEAREKEHMAVKDNMELWASMVAKTGNKSLLAIPEGKTITPELKAEITALVKTALQEMLQEAKA